MGSGRGWLGLHLLNLKEKHIQSLIIKRLHRKRFSIAYVPGSFFCEKVTSSPSFSLMDSSASETRARVKINLVWISLSKRYSCPKSWPKVTRSPIVSSLNLSSAWLSCGCFPQIYETRTKNIPRNQLLRTRRLDLQLYEPERCEEESKSSVPSRR